VNRVELWKSLRAAVLEAGCTAVGVTDARPFPEVQQSLKDRKAAGMHAGMHFTFGDPERSTDISRSFPWARSLVVAGFAYLPQAGSPEPARSNHGRVARFATDDHYRGLRGALDRAAQLLTAAGYHAELVVDDNRLVDRAAAVRAGVGWWGKNTMVLAPGAGPWMLLGSIVTDAEFESTPSMVRDCGTCDACLPACPTGALVQPGVLDARLCLAHVLQARGWIPRELRRDVGDRIYGCDDCLDACPPGTKLESTAAPWPRQDLLALLERSDEELMARFEHFYVPRRRADFLRRNILVALGNGGDESAVPVVSSYLTHPEPMLRAHAAWALGQIGGERAAGALLKASRAEADSEVQMEIETALASYAWPSAET
jgi:epoxyqueuosine reductase